jgi:type IV secretory pathway TrbD component
MSNQKKVTPLFQCFTRPMLMMGGERENIIIITCLSLMLWTAGRDVLSGALALVVFGVGFFVSKIAAKNDPWATKVYINSLQYQDFYPAREKVNTPKCVIKRKRDL